MCRSMVDIQSPTAEIRRGKKKKKKKKKKEERNRMKIYMVSLFHRATINKGPVRAQKFIISGPEIAISGPEILSLGQR